MKKILLFVCLFVSVQMFSQTIPGYNTRTVREKLIAMSVDSGLHIPRYNGAPSGLRVGVYVADGQIAMDTTNHRLYIYSGGAWVRMASFAEVGSTYTANLPIRVTGTVISADTSVAFSPSLTTNARLQQIVDSLNAAGAFGIPTLQQVTTSGSSSNVSIELTGEDGSDGHALSLVNAYLPLLIQNNFNPSTTAAVDGIMMIRANNAGNGINNQALRITYVNENGSGTQFATGYTEHILTDATAGSLDVHYNIGGVENSVSKTFMNIQTGGIVRVNNNADTLATKDYARSVGGGGSESTTASNVGTGAGVFKQLNGVDLEFRSLVAGDGIGIVQNTNDVTISSTVSLTSSEPWYKYWLDPSGNAQPYFFQGASGAGSGLTRPASAMAAGYMGGMQLATGTSTTGRSFIYFGNGGGYAPIAISSSFRYNVGAKVRLEDLSDGTDTYEFYFGFGDEANEFSSVVDGVGFRYTSTDSSGAWICWSKNNSTTTEDAVGSAIAADTDYNLEVSVIGGTAYFYINSTLVATISTNIPDDDTARITAVNYTIRKLAGTNSRNAYCEWLALGKRNN